MAQTYIYKEGDLVEYNIGFLKGTGVVRGVATIGAAVIGQLYIIEDRSSNVPSDIYQYSHFGCLEVNLKMMERKAE